MAVLLAAFGNRMGIGGNPNVICSSIVGQGVFNGGRPIFTQLNCPIRVGGGISVEITNVGHTDFLVKVESPRAQGLRVCPWVVMKTSDQHI